MIQLVYPAAMQRFRQVSVVLETSSARRSHSRLDPNLTRGPTIGWLESGPWTELPAPPARAAQSRCLRFRRTFAPASQ